MHHIDLSICLFYSLYLVKLAHSTLYALYDFQQNVLSPKTDLDNPELYINRELSWFDLTYVLKRRRST